MQDPPGELTITGTPQREAWLRRVMPPAERLDQDLWSLPLPIPGNPLRYVSVYASGTGEGLVLIDLTGSSGSAFRGPPGLGEHRRGGDVGPAAVRQQRGGGQGDHHARDDVDGDRLPAEGRQHPRREQRRRAAGDQ
jgi:hypothetical protein